MQTGLSEAAPKSPTGERIAKRIARAGLCSRREAETWIRDGRVVVNGTRITSPALDVEPAAAIKVDGKLLPEAEPTRLFRYNKPRGVITTARDPEGRPTIFDTLPPGLPRLMPVGRLDINSEGLILLTNDGELKRTLELPATGWLRRYKVRAYGRVEEAALRALANGVTVDGAAYGPIEARIDRVQGGNLWISLSLREGRNREVRRVMAHLGLEVSRLIRLAYGPFQLGTLARRGIEEITGKVIKDQLGRGAKEPARRGRRAS